ncbi:MAG TPA: hypothetical protein VIM58_01775 [Candidatus Methylacidiphilales bacterium]
MKTRLPIALGGVAILLVGLALGWWIALRRPPAPLPPVPWTGPGRPPKEGEAKRDDRKERPKPTAEQVAKFRAEFDQQIAPELEAFQKGYTALTQDFDAKFDALLTPEQHALRERMRGPGGSPGSGGVDWIAEFRSLADARVGGPQEGAAGPQGPGPGPGNDPRNRRRQQERLQRALLHVVMYEPFLRLSVDTFKLTPEQTAATAKLMEERRVAFLKLADAHPLPFDRLYLSLRELGFLPPPGGNAGNAGPGGNDQPPQPAPAPQPAK